MNKMHLITADLIYAGPNQMTTHWSFAFAADQQLGAMVHAWFQFVLNREHYNVAGKLQHIVLYRVWDPPAFSLFKRT